MTKPTIVASDPPNIAASPLNSKNQSTSSPQIFARQARQMGEWKDLIYREALRMTGALRQILTSGNNNRSQLAKKFLNKFNGLLSKLRKPTGLIGIDSDYLDHSDDFENLLNPWIEIFQSEDLTGPYIHSSILSIRSFLHSGMFTDPESPFSRPFIHDLVFALAHSRFEPTTLENDEIVMLELIEFLAELVQITIASTKTVNYSNSTIKNDELIGETFLFQLFDLLFVLFNQNRFSELLRAKAIEIAVDQCSLLFSSMKKISSNCKALDSATSGINFPNIVKPQKPTTPTISSRSAVNSDSLINVRNFESVIIVDNENESGNLNIDSTETVNRTNSPSNASPTGNPTYDPFNDEADNELAPDVIAEVMKFRAKLAGISIESTEQAEQEQSYVNSVDLFHDRLSSHALREVLVFLIRCIDIIDTPANKKAPGSVGNVTTTNTLSKVIPSIKTQMTAMKCLVAIFTDPISDLAKPIANPTLFETEVIELIGGDLLKQLMSILSLDTSSRHLSSLSQLFLVIFTNFRPYLLAQFEYFISTCLGIISTKPASNLNTANPSSGGNAHVTGAKSIPKPALTALKTICLELISYFLQDPSFIAQIFVYYECSLDYQNTLELLTKGISAGMEKSSGNEEIISLSGDILCNFIKTIETSLIKIHSKVEIEDLKNLLDQRRVKMIYSEAAVLFNSSPKEAFPFLQQKGLLSSEPSKSEIASFLRKAQGLDKKVLGEYLAKPDNIEILREFFSAFRFSESTPLDLALRQVLESFRLPGEAQQIDRIMECFAQIYYPSAKANFKSQDSCFILSYSTLMLNTDLHNPQVKNKMTLTQFIKNNRGIDDGGDLAGEYLEHIYNSIKTREIVMPEEHGGQEAFTSQWNEVQKRKEINSKLESNLTLSPLVCGIVEIVWKPIILSLIPYINQQRPTGEVISDGPLEALRGIASLFEKFQMTEALDALLGNIWSVSNLIPVFSAASGNMIPRYLARLPGFRQVVQLIVEIFRGQGDGLKTSWTNWCRLLIILSESGLLGIDSVITQESVLFDPKNEAVSLMNLIKMAHEGRQVQPIGRQSFMSSLTRFFANNPDKPQETTIAVNNTVTTNTNVVIDESTLAARKFVDNLPILEVLTRTIPEMQSKSFTSAIESICIHLKWNLGAGASTGKRMSPASTIGLNWTEDTLILLTETLVTIGLACDPEKELQSLLPIVFDTLSRLILQDPPPPVKLCEHVVIGLGRLMLRLAEVKILPVDRFVGYLKFWCQLSPQLQGFTLEPALALIALIFGKINEEGNSEIWPPMFTILSTVSKFETSSPYTLKLLNLICSYPVFPLDFFTEFVDLLSSSIISCTPANCEIKVFDPWRNGENITRGQVAEESIKIYEKLFSKLDKSFDTWRDYLIPLESNLSRHAPLHSLKTIRKSSINLLTRLLPQMPRETPAPVAPIIFSKVIIPLLMDLRLRQADCDEIVTRCSSLACKIFLLHLNSLGQPIAQLWKEILESLLPLILTGNPSELLKESVLESCKNVLLVMQSSGIEEENEVWRVSDVMLGPLIPGWKMELEMRISGHGISEMSEKNAGNESASAEIVGITGNEDISEDAEIEATEVQVNSKPTEPVVSEAIITEPTESAEPLVLSNPSPPLASESHVDRDIISAFENTDGLLSLDDITDKPSDSLKTFEV